MMKAIGKGALAVLVGFLLVNLLFGGRGENNPELPALIKKGALIIDTRTPGEYSNGHVKGAINIPYDSIAEKIVFIETDQAKPIIVYCRSGNRSAHAKGYLNEAGYTNVVNAGSIGNLQKQIHQ
jgi:rhodanese-related sulfurtransferase